MHGCAGNGAQNIIVTRLPTKRPRLQVVEATPDSERVITDDALLDGLARGDASLGSELCRRLMRVVDGTLYRVLGGRDGDHEDLVQASFEQIVRSLSAGKFARECALSTWAAAITCNVALHAIRRRRTERKIFDDALGSDELSHKPSAAADPESQVTSRRELERVRLHLSQMSEKLAQALLLSDVLGCTQAEVASLLNVSVPAAQARLFRGRQELADRLSRDAGNSGGETR